MFLFEPSSRVQRTDEGIRFYEQDVLCSEYGFSGDQKIEIKLDYIIPGFGVAFIEEPGKGKSIGEAFNAFLMKLGANDFRVIRKHFDKQEEVHVDSCMITPGESQKNLTLIFELSGTYFSISQKVIGSDGNESEVLVAEYDMPSTFESFRIGFYSNAGNTIRNIVFLTSIPQHWHVNVKNCMGGRIAFTRNTARIENCEHHAELEQRDIPLGRGTYYLKYETEKVNDKCDIIPYVITKDITLNNRESNLEDDAKNLLEEDNSFELDNPMEVNLKFKGHNGIIKNIFITRNNHSSYLETKDEQIRQDGSYIIISLKNLRRVTWEATIYDVCPWEDYTKACPYAVIEGASDSYNIDDLHIFKNNKYRYVYEVDSNTLTITDMDGKAGVVAQRVIIPNSNRITIFRNVTATIFKFILTDVAGSDIDVLLRKTFKKYIPAEIESPLIITAKGSSEPFDLSSSYREVVSSKQTIALFSKEHPLIMKESLPINANKIQIYGIPKGASLDVTADNIDDFATNYFEISEDYYSRKDNTIYMDVNVRKRYEYIAVCYQSLQDFEYYFTNYEREIYDGDTDVLELEKPTAKREQDIIVYGIPKNARVISDYLYRVPSIGMINSIDYYADDYDIITPDKYVVDFNTHEIKISDELSDGRYETFVVDYLKKDSYAINFQNGYSQYEVNIATENNTVIMHYDMHKDGTIREYIRTEITPDKDKYIVLKPDGEV